jgi:hypothetical protein
MPRGVDHAAQSREGRRTLMEATEAIEPVIEHG